MFPFQPNNKLNASDLNVAIKQSYQNFTADEDIGARVPVIINSSGHIQKGTIDQIENFLGFTMEAVSSGVVTPSGVQVSGIVDGLSGLTVGQYYTLGITAGELVISSGVETIGYAIDTDKLLITKRVPDTQQGDIIIRGANGFEKLPVGAAEQFLKSQGSNANPIWVGAVGTNEWYKKEEAAESDYNMTTQSAEDDLYSGSLIRAGMQSNFTINIRAMTEFHFWAKKVGSSSGDVYVRIRKVSDDSIVVEKLWGDASDLPTTFTELSVVFADIIGLDTNLRISVEFDGGDASNYVALGYYDSGNLGGFCHSTYATSWSDDPNTAFDFRIVTIDAIKIIV